ncbi:MAG: metallophosphoesterase [Planctomycetota bacterium]
MSIPIIVLCDTHFGHDDPGDQRLVELAAEVLAIDAAALVIAGDLGTTSGRGIDACLELFSHFKGIKAITAGNHDLWAPTDKPDLTADEIYNDRLPSKAKEYGFVFLDNDAPVALPDHRYLCGSTGWYDFSFRDDTLSATLDDYLRQTYLGSTWNDARHIKGDFDILEFHRGQVERIRAQLQSLPPDAVACCVTHFIPDAVLLPPEPERRDALFRFGRAFLGSRSFGEIYRSDPRVQLAVSGHSHWKMDVTDGGIRWVNPGGGYNEKRAIIVEF